MVHQQFNRREFNAGASLAIAATTNPLAGVSLPQSGVVDYVASRSAGLMSRSMSEAAIEKMCRKIVLNDCADSLIRQPNSFPVASWQQQVQIFEEMGGVPGSFPDLLRHALNKPGSFAHDSLLSASPEARFSATEKIDELCHLSVPKKDLGQSLRSIENALGRRLDLMYRLNEADPRSFRLPIVDASLWGQGFEE